LALGQINKTNLRWLITRETIVGLGNGLLWALVVSAVATWWFQDFIIAQIIAIAMIINLLVAVLSGVSVPLLLRYFRLDPGIGGIVIVTTITDVAGFMSFLGLASIYLRKVYSNHSRNSVLGSSTEPETFHLPLLSLLRGFLKAFPAM